MKVYFKPAFEDRLVAYKIKKRFVYNLIATRDRKNLYSDPIILSQYGNNAPDWEGFIGLIDWNLAPEGPDFWKVISSEPGIREVLELKRPYITRLEVNQGLPFEGQFSFHRDHIKKLYSETVEGKKVLVEGVPIFFSSLTNEQRAIIEMINIGRDLLLQTI
jgi:hypothetical protein